MPENPFSYIYTRFIDFWEEGYRFIPTGWYLPAGPPIR